MLPLHPLTWATRQELDLELRVLEGTLPDDLSGHVFINSPVGTVNSEGTPLPKTRPDGTENPEWGDMLFNGDGMLFRFDLDQPGRVGVKSRILKTPDYWADLATKYGTTYAKQGFCFQNWGMARTNSNIGSRNQINTSVNLLRAPGSDTIRLTANFDAGRPFEIDPLTLEAVRPIGSNGEWKGELPSLLDELFPLHQSTAHPSFDPETREFYTVNFRKDLTTLLVSQKFHPDVTARQQWLTKEIVHLTKLLGGKKLQGRQMLALFDAFVDHLHTKHAEGHNRKFALPSQVEERDLLGMENEVALLRWTGSGPLQRWNLLDPDTGKNLVIEQTMHQTALSRNWIVLVDSSLKFAIDILLNNPFPDLPWLNRLLRRLFARTIQPVTPLYLVRRADLVDGVTDVPTVKVWIPLETVHYSVDFDDTDDVVSVYTSHNAALCAAEWVRPYDFQAVDGKPVDESVLGILTSGEMDIGRTGVFRIHAPTGTIREQKIVWKTGLGRPFPGAPKGLHTWAVGLNTYRGQNDALALPERIPSIFWQFYGLDKRLLTKFIEDLYRHYPNRKIPVWWLKWKARRGVPFCLSRQNTATQEFEDGWLFELNQNLRSLQFVPRRRPSKAPEVPADRDGYILCTMINGPASMQGNAYTREVWIFDADRLRDGPVVKLGHEDLSYAFTIHSIWSPRLDRAPEQPVYDVREDCAFLLAAINDEAKRAEYAAFLEAEVYPHYDRG